LILPAVTADYLQLPWPDGPPRDAVERPVLTSLRHRTALKAKAFQFTVLLPGLSPALLDLFVHIDQIGAVCYAPGEPKGTP
jgi:quercetin 2,3-dioxygenase